MFEDNPLYRTQQMPCAKIKEKNRNIISWEFATRIFFYQSRSECSYNARVNSFRLPCNFSETFRGESLDELNH